MKRTSSELKRLSKGALLGNYSLPVKAFLLSTVLLTGISTIISLVFPLTTALSTVLYCIATFIFELLGSVLSAGVSVILLDISRGGRGQFQDLFYGFRHQPDRILLSQLLIALLSLICCIPGILVLRYAVMASSLIAAIPAIFLLIAGIAAALVISLNYSLVIPLYIDCPEKQVLQLMRESRMLMKGNKGRLFYLQLSFIGLSLLCILTCFIGMLWLAPYMEMTHMMFYREAVHEI